MKIRKATIEDLKELAEIEAKCFPVEEAATEESFKVSFVIYPNFFWILENEDGKRGAVVNGMVSDKEVIEDEMFENPSMHNSNGKWQMIFGVNTLPEYRRQGLAEKVLRHVIEDARKQGRKGAVLTCKDRLVNYYAKLGFVNEGISCSSHGGAVWYDMRIVF